VPWWQHPTTAAEVEAEAEAVSWAAAEVGARREVAAASWVV